MSHWLWMIVGGTIGMTVGLLINRWWAAKTDCFCNRTTWHRLYGPACKYSETEKR